MKLYGTNTSPYVRRVRVLALELGLDTVMVDTFSEAGQATLRSVSPIFKVPTAEIGGRVIWDSAAITEHLLATHGHGDVRPAQDPVRENNIRHAIDGALDAAINVMYLERDGVDVKSVAYTRKQSERVVTCLEYVASELREGYFTDDRRVGVTEIALVTTLDWFVFRKRHPVDTIPALAAALRVHEARESFVTTRPS